MWEAVCGDDCCDGAIDPFAERAGMKKICESKIDRSILQAVAELEKLGWLSFMLAVPRYNKQMLKEKLPEVKMILRKFSYPYNRRIAGAHRNFSKQDHKKWLKEADKESLSQALRRLAQLNQTKVFEFFLFHLNFASLSFSFSRSSKCYYYGYS